MSYEDKLRKYEKEKRKLQMQGLTDKEYEIAIRKLVKRLGI